MMTAAVLVSLALIVTPAMARNAPDESAPKASRSGACDAACLRGMVEQYLGAVAARDPGRLPLAKHVRFTELGQQLELGDGFPNLPPGVFNYFALDCAQQFESGYLAVVTRIRHRRFMAVDPELGTVFALAVFDQAGT
jgi:hypothetical protein